MQQNTYNKWLEIDLNAVINNLTSIRSLLKEQVKLIAVLKANAYGYGAVAVANVLANQGVEYFAVSHLEEALGLRKAGINANILLFIPLINEGQLAEAVLNDITLTVASLYHGLLIDKVSRKIRRIVTVHLKIDTGLGRFGIDNGEIIQLAKMLADNPYICLEGIYTHMAAGGTNIAYTKGQFQEFINTVDKLLAEGIEIPLCHCANSAVLLNYPEMQLDAVRIGTLLAGQFPVGRVPLELQISNPCKLKTRIVAINILNKGSYLGYYRTFRLKQKAKIAVIPVGFCDGLALSVNNRPIGVIDLMKLIFKKILNYFDLPGYRLSVKIEGRTYPIRGKVFMQMALIEIPLDSRIEIGDEVEIPVNNLLVGENIKRSYSGIEKRIKNNHLNMDKEE